MAVASVDDRELIKAMSWFDGFVVALANPSFLLTALGGSVLSLGGWGATIVWTFSVLIGALHNNIYAEVAAMFPKLSGGVAVYAHEAWKRYTSFVGPIAAVGYWLGWSVVLSLNGAIVGFLLQAAVLRRAARSARRTSDWGIVNFYSSPAILIGAVAILVDLGRQRLRRPAGGLDRLRDRRAAALPALRAHRRPVHHGRLELGQPAQLHRLRQLQHLRDHGLGRLAHLQRRLAARDHLALPDVLVVVRLRVLRLVRARVPRPGARHGEGAARRGACSACSSTRLLPIGALGTFGDQNVTLNNTLTFYGDTFRDPARRHGADILVVMLCAGIVLSMNTATMDGSRALYGISQDGMTIRWLGKLNRNNVPGNAMTLDAVLNLVLLFLAIGALAGGGYLKILAVSNFGYVIAHIFAISGFLLLRKDRPGLAAADQAGADVDAARGRSAWCSTSSTSSSARSRSA